MTLFKEIEDKFLAHLHTKKTKDIYTNLISDVLRYTEKSDLMLVNQEELDGYLEHLKDLYFASKLSANTLIVRIKMMRGIFSFIRKLGFSCSLTAYYPQSIMWTKRDIPELDAVLDYFSKLPSGDVLETVSFLVLYCGLSVSEICNLKVKDVILSGIVPGLHIVFGGVVRIINVPQFLYDKLCELCAGRKGSEYLFLTSRKLPFSAKYLQRKRAEYTSFSLQDLRSFAFVQMFASGMSPETFKRYTGVIKNYDVYLRESECAVSFFSYSHVYLLNMETA